MPTTGPRGETDVSILAVYRDHLGLTPHRQSEAESFGRCPFCGGQDRPGGPSDRFRLFVDDDRAWCRRCEWKGDAIQLLRDTKSLGYREALAALGREPDQRPKPTTPPQARPPRPLWEPKALEPPPAAWQEKAGRFVEHCARELEHDAEVLEWLAAERGIKAETARAARLGWNPADTWRDRAAWGLPPALREDGRPKKLFLPAGLVLPVLDAAGDVLRVKVRRPDPGQGPKYLPLAQPEPPCTAPLVVRGGPGAKAWAIVESELDGLLLAQAAGELVHVVALGSASYRPSAALWAELTAAPFVLLALDFDDAGGKAACGWWKDHLPVGRCRVWPVPEGKDPTEAWRAGWDLREWIAGGLPPSLLPPRPDPTREAQQAALASLLDMLPQHGGRIARTRDHGPLLRFKDFDWSRSTPADMEELTRLMNASGPAFDRYAAHLPLED